MDVRTGGKMLSNTWEEARVGVAGLLHDLLILVLILLNNGKAISMRLKYGQGENGLKNIETFTLEGFLQDTSFIVKRFQTETLFCSGILLISEISR